jgi:toxin ParE1/3/4
VFTVKLLTEAEIEVSESCKWYEKQQAGLGKRFLKEVNHYLNLIAKDPFKFPIRFSKTYRFATLKIFPYLIAFRVEDEGKLIYIISIFHTSRNPVNF